MRYGEPQNTPTTEARPKDCYDFADEVERIENGIFDNNRNPATNSFPHNVNAFMDTLARRFTEIPSATLVGLATVRFATGTRLISEFGTRGFREAFFDNDPESFNQARHTVFGLVSGYAGLSLHHANNREERGTASGDADIALNGLTVPMGQKLAGPLGQQFAKSLAGWIRDNLCDPQE